MNTKQKKIFLVFSGGNDRAVIGFLRALRECGLRACIVARTKKDRILKTAFKRDVVWVRNGHELNLPLLTNCIAKAQEASGNGVLCILPSTEYLNSFLLKHKNEIESMGCEIPLVTHHLYRILSDKSSSIKFFSEAGFHVPREAHLGGADGLPLVAKPYRNISDDERTIYPHLLVTPEDLTHFLESENPTEYFFQEYVFGENIYLLFYIARDTQSRFVWSQRNLLQQPAGKSMILAEPSTFHLTPTAKRMVDTLREIGFWGLGMIEVFKDDCRETFIEMNPRIWGPIQFSIDQAQPILHAFIGDVLHGDPLTYLDQTNRSKSKRRNYFWLGGLVETLCLRKQLKWHSTERPLYRLIFSMICADIYLRGDTWKCFVQDLWASLKKGSKRD